MADLSNLSDKKKRDIEALIEMVRGMSNQSDSDSMSDGGGVINTSVVSEGDSTSFSPEDILPTKEDAKLQESDMYVEEADDGWSSSNDGWSESDNSADGWSESSSTSDDGWGDNDAWLNGEEPEADSYEAIKQSTREERTNHIQSDMQPEKPKREKIIAFPMSQVDIDNAFNPDLQQIAEELKNEGNAVQKTTSFDVDFVNILKSAGFYDKRKEASRSKNVEKKVNSQVLYKEDTLTDYNGNPKEYKRVICNANWGSGFYDNLSNENCLKNLGMLRREVTQSILSYFGSWDRIHDIYVEDEILVINGFAYTPKLLNMDANISKFPLDTYEYIKTGRIASLFDWSVLNYMSNLRVLSLQTFDFANDVVANDLEMDFFSIATFFSSLPKLQIIHIEGQTIDRNKPKEKAEDDEDKTVYESMNDSLKLKARISQAFGNYNFNIYTATNAGQDFFVNSLKDYAKNRGSKGFLRYSAGVVGRFVGATAATTLNAGLHLIGGVAKGLFQTFKDAMTPVDNQ